MSIEGQGHFFTIYFPGFVCFVLYWAKISGERLQDHWSSGFCECHQKLVRFSLFDIHFSEVSSFIVFRYSTFISSEVSSFFVIRHLFLRS